MGVTGFERLSTWPVLTVYTELHVLGEGKIA
jgi:hypothetical protein